MHKEAVIQDQGVRAALLTIGESEIELLEPVAPDTGVARFLAQRGEGLHHLCFQTDDIDRELESAKRRGVTLIDRQPRAGLAGTICFLHPRSSHGVPDRIRAAVNRAGALLHGGNIRFRLRKVALCGMGIRRLIRNRFATCPSRHFG